MEKEIIRGVSYRRWDNERQDYRVYSATSVVSEEPEKEQKLEVCADEMSLEITKEDVPLLVKVLQEFV